MPVGTTIGGSQLPFQPARPPATYFNAAEATAPASHEWSFKRLSVFSDGAVKIEISLSLFFFKSLTPVLTMCNNTFNAEIWQFIFTFYYTETWTHTQTHTHTHIYIQGVPGGIVNILGGGTMDYSEEISSYKHVSNFQWVWRYSSLNVARTDRIFVCGDGLKTKSTKKSKHTRRIGRSHYE